MSTAGLGVHTTQFGAINSLRTGNILFDMLLCMMIPAILKFVIQLMENASPEIKEFLNKLRFGGKHEYNRFIDHEKLTTSWGHNLTGKDERNNILQKAITLYIGLKKINYKEANVSLMAFKEKGTRDNDTWEMNYGSTAEQLKLYDINILPPDNEWVELEPGLQFRQERNTGDEGGEKNKLKRTNIRFILRSSEPDGEERINRYLDAVYKWYIEQMHKIQDNARYMYILITKDPWEKPAENNEGGGNNSNEKRQYKRYKLSDDKTFSSLFFTEKQSLLKIIDHFVNKTGKYAIPGYPHKLGMLLHGPPGTGKTSLIKALAHYTNRNVVSIPLARIKTNQELMDIVFDQSFAVMGEELPVKLSFKDIIFVMEDVDCASKIVHRRDEPAQATKKSKSSSQDQKSETETKTNANPVETPTAASTSMLDSDAGLLLALASSLGDNDKSKFSSKNDKLDLSGLLNVLDGIVDCPNRILVMTTNHPEKLDPALIRPGRIDKKLLLDYIKYDEAIKMIEHYFQLKLSDTQKDDLEAIFECGSGIKVTPAQIEQFCAEHDSVGDFLESFEKQFSVAPPPLLSWASIG